jgi:hypothetical protein
MGSTGKRNNMIQVSHSTADLLVAANKGHWIDSRDDSVMPKGMQHGWNVGFECYL